MQPHHFPAGATIFRVGDASEGVFVIEEGEVAITVPGGMEVARLGAGELFGESGVLEDRPRAASATVVQETVVLVTPAETFKHAFGMDNDRALALVKLLCRRLRKTNLRASLDVAPEPAGNALRLLPDSDRLTAEYGMTPVIIGHLPFQVGNRYGGETLPIASNHGFCVPARGEPNLGAPHFEILRRDGRIGARDLGTAHGTIINGVVSSRASTSAFVALRAGSNEIIAGRSHSVFRFRLYLG